MLQDPFYVVKSEVELSVNGIETLFTRWQELLKSSSSSTEDEFRWTSDELKSGLRSIELDLQDLQETISIVENNRAKFKLADEELADRKSFIQDTQATISTIKKSLNSPEAKGKLSSTQHSSLMKTSKKGNKKDKHARLHAAIEADNDAFIASESQQQSQILADQDTDLSALQFSVGTLAELGEAINSELETQNVMLEELEADVDTTSAKMGAAIKKVDKLLDQASEKHPWCIIIILLIVLVALMSYLFS